MTSVFPHRVKVIEALILYFPKQEVRSPVGSLQRATSCIPPAEFHNRKRVIKFVSQAEFTSLNAETQSPTEFIPPATEVHFPTELFPRIAILKQSLSLAEYSQTTRSKSPA